MFDFSFLETELWEAPILYLNPGAGKPCAGHERPTEPPALSSKSLLLASLGTLGAALPTGSGQANNNGKLAQVSALAYT